MVRVSPLQLHLALAGDVKMEERPGVQECGGSRASRAVKQGRLRRRACRAVKAKGNGEPRMDWE